MAYLDNIAVFVRVVELGNLSSAGRDMRLSPAVASNRVKELEKHLGVRLFNRTTRQLTPTEQGRVFYEGARKVLEAVAEAEASVADLSGQPRGTNVPKRTTSAPSASTRNSRAVAPPRGMLTLSQPAKTTATSLEWRHSWRACRSRSRAPQPTGSAGQACKP